MGFSEQHSLPNTAVKSIGHGQVVILSVHPADHVFGCSGAIMYHIGMGDPVQVITVTDDASGEVEEANENVLNRRQQSEQAANILGCSASACWGLSDRELEYGEFLIRRILNCLEDGQIDLIYVPSWWEIDADHRALSTAAAEAVRRCSRPVRLVMYEVGVPLQPNTLLDISDVFDRKQSAMSCFTSRMPRQRFDRQVTALNRFRTYTLPADVQAAEAYRVLFRDDLQRELTLMKPSVDYHGQHQLSLGTTQPLVSVIIRSMDRRLLGEALDSVALQSYPHIEVVVVNAKGTEHSELPEWCGRFPLRLVSSGSSLPRSRAANLGLDNAHGDYLIFLDDDDVFYPDHIASLMEVLGDSGTARCAYTGVQVDFFLDGQIVRSTVYNQPFRREKLWGRNYIPIHAVLFEKSLCNEGCRFDEQLDIFEDWDFWVQLSRYTEFVHLDQVTACYRNYGSSGLGEKMSDEYLHKSTGVFFEKWRSVWSGQQIAEIILYRDTMKDHCDHHIDLLTSQLDLLKSQLDEVHRDLNGKEEALQHERSEREHYRQLSALQENRLAELQAEQKKQQQLIDLMHKQLAERDIRVSSLHQTIDQVYRSKSWALTSPLRFFGRLLRGQHQQAFAGLGHRLEPLGRIAFRWTPRRWREPLLHFCYRFAGPLFGGMEHYHIWRRRNQYPVDCFPVISGETLMGMLDIRGVAPLNIAPSGRIAIHAHIFYIDLVRDFAKFFHHMPFSYDLFVSVPDNDIRYSCEQSFAKLPRLGRLLVSVVPNRGRDIAPMFCVFGAELREYEYLAHLHSKKSLYNKGGTHGWLEYLLSSLLGSEQQVRKIFSLLSESNGFGIVYPQNFSKLPFTANSWLSNLPMGRDWCQKLGICNILPGYFNFPAGSMFWARVEALLPLFDAGLKTSDFAEESGQIDGTLAHCIERLFVLTTNKSGFKAAILQDLETPRWSPWGMEQYVGRSRSNVEALINDTDVQVIIFDIFDTLLLRPLLNPESIKNLVAALAGGEVSKIYLKWRAKAEVTARQKAGRDVGLEMIYEELFLLSGLPQDTLAQLRRLEETAEMDAVSPRADAVDMLRYALAAGKRVVLASDMYLPKSIVEAMLTEHGVNGWHDLYLSSDIGLRKDSGELFHHILAQEGVVPEQVLMIGDNEHSDLQIPIELAMKICYVLRPVELARAIPRLGPLMEKALRVTDLNEQLTFGLIARANFHPIFYPHFDPTALFPSSPRAIGYSIVGPMVLSFIQWLAEKAEADGIQRLYFLSREGQVLKMVYDYWALHDAKAPPADYLVLSRRAVTVPLIKGLEDIYAIARSLYFPNDIANFIRERFGLELDDQEWTEIWRQGLWHKNKPVEVRNGQIEHLKPLLQALEERILTQSKNELPGLAGYLEKMGLNREATCAVVDIGYSATIQGRLNRFLNRKVHGYYFITDKAAEMVSVQYNVATQGCFGHFVNREDNATALLTKSFELEKLLSSDEAQVVCYRYGGDDEILSEFRVLSDAELHTREVRAEIQNGVMAFVDNAVAVRKKLLNNYIVPTSVAHALYEAFIDRPAEAEEAILSKLVLDDHYCGRGLVS